LESQLEKALIALEQLRREGMKSPEIIGALASQLERLKRGSELLAKGHSAQEIGMRMGVNPFFQDKFMTQLRVSSVHA